MTSRDGRGIVFDALAVLVFVAIGRLQHDGSDAFAPADFLETLWPFVGGLAIALLVAMLTHRSYRTVSAGMGIAAVTVVGGLCLRYASGQGLAVSFAIVTGIVIGALMLGWRIVVRRISGE